LPFAAGTAFANPMQTSASGRTDDVEEITMDGAMLAPGPTAGAPASPALRADVPTPTLPDIIDAAARILVRRGYQGLLFGGIARELGVPTRLVLRTIADKPLLVRYCYQRTVSALEACLMDAETMSGSAAQKIEIFLDRALTLRAERGGLLPLALADGPTRADVRRWRDKDRMIRTRVERLIRLGQRDGSLNARDPGAACHLILSLLMSPDALQLPEARWPGVGELRQLVCGGIAAR
jgi:AcrR family transcriptional regulator